MREYNLLLDRVAANRTTAWSPVVTVDMHAGWDRSVHTYDGLHPDQDGDIHLASRWAAALRDHLGIGA